MEFTQNTLENWRLDYHNWLQFYPFNHVLASTFQGVQAHDPFHTRRAEWMPWLEANIPADQYELGDEGHIRFRTKKAAVLFKMRWGSNKSSGTSVGGIE